MTKRKITLAGSKKSANKAESDPLVSGNAGSLTAKILKNADVFVPDAIFNQPDNRSQGALPATNLTLIDIVQKSGAQEALKIAVQAIESKSLTAGDVMNFALVIEKELDKSVVASLYKTWLDAMGDTADAFLVWFNFGCILKDLGMLVAAEEVYRKVVALRPDLYQAAHNLGLTLEAEGRQDEAIAIWTGAVQSIEAQTALINQAGRLLEVQRKFDEAEKILTRSLLIDPNQPDVVQHWVHLRQKMCKWPATLPLTGLPPEKIKLGMGTMAAIAEYDDPKLQLEAALNYVTRKVVTGRKHLAPKGGYQNHGKIRVGYMSSDFRMHAVTILAAEIFEHHNKEKFEIYGFCFSQDDGSDVRRQLIGHLDHYVPIHALTDDQAAQLIRSYEIDILIDLNGLTSGARPNILAWKPAPVQVAYIGFVGTCGLPEVDYVLADHYIFPEELKPFFTEKPLYMPNVFQVNNRRRVIAPRPDRSTCNLPDDKFVFCSFNNSYKITPAVFDSWMRILKRVPNSVLWLLEDNPWHRENLEREARDHGIDINRLIFAGRVHPAQYLARYQCADLMLDTMPYNAGTTASDALWAGLPVLTFAGKTFASRMAGSLLNVLGLKELITEDWLSFEDRAVMLANSPSELAGIKKRIEDARETSVLYDSARFTKDMEEILSAIALRPGNA